MPLVAFSGYFIGLRIMLVAGNQASKLVVPALPKLRELLSWLRQVISLLPFFGTLALLAAPSLLLEAGRKSDEGLAAQSKHIRRGLLAIATAATVMPVLPLVLVPANSRYLATVTGRAHYLVTTWFRVRRMLL